MRGYDAAVCVKHRVGVSVVCCYKESAVLLCDGVIYVAYAAVNSFHGLYGSVKHACMADHVRVGEVHYYEVVFS